MANIKNFFIAFSFHVSKKNYLIKIKECVVKEKTEGSRRCVTTSAGTTT